MRLILGMILGVALTIGGAYVSDTAEIGPGCASDGQLGRGRQEHRLAHHHDQAGLGKLTA